MSCQTISQARLIMALVLTWMEFRSRRNPMFCWAALATMVSSTSVTLTGEVGWLPMALTTTTFWLSRSRAISCAASMMRWAVATQVPPNLCTCSRQDELLLVNMDGVQDCDSGTLIGGIRALSAGRMTWKMGARTASAPPLGTPHVCALLQAAQQQR